MSAESWPRWTWKSIFGAVLDCARSRAGHAAEAAADRNRRRERVCMEPPGVEQSYSIRLGRLRFRPPTRQRQKAKAGGRLRRRLRVTAKLDSFASTRLPLRCHSAANGFS